MSKQKYYHVDTKKIEGISIEAKSGGSKGTGITYTKSNKSR